MDADLNSTKSVTVRDGCDGFYYSGGGVQKTVTAVTNRHALQKIIERADLSLKKFSKSFLGPFEFLISTARKI